MKKSLELIQRFLTHAPFTIYRPPFTMKTILRLLIISAVLINIAACSTIKTWFPDKEKDYQFTTEIPPLILPPDLAGDSIAKSPIAKAPVANTPETTAAVTTAPKVEAAPTIDRKLIQLELIDADQGTKRLRIGAPSEIAWRMVGKALSRKSIEVTNRNQEAGVFHVQYTANKEQVEDESIWDEITFALKGLVVTEQEYEIKLVGIKPIDNTVEKIVENKPQTDIIILNKEQKLATDETSLKLLALLHHAIKADLHEAKDEGLKARGEKTILR